MLCTHPMFGPKSGKGSWAGLPFVYDKVRISKGWRSRAADMFLDIFVSEVNSELSVTSNEISYHEQQITSYYKSMPLKRFHDIE